MTTSEHAHTLNIWLAAALRSQGLNARGEVARTGNRRIYVQVRISPIVVAVEAKHGQNPSKRSDEHFSVAGTLVEAAASFRRRDDDNDSTADGEGPSGDLRGEKLSNATHLSTTAPDA